MSQQNENAEPESDADETGIPGTVQKIIGDIEVIGGVLTGDPITQAEGEFNREVGDIKEDLEEEQDEQ